MKQKVFAVYDSKAEVYTPPFYMVKTPEAIRAFAYQVNQPGNDFNRFPADYTLFEIGAFDNETGLLTPLGTPKSLGLAQEYIGEDNA